MLDTVDTLLGRLEEQRELAFKRENFDDIGIHELELVSLNFSTTTYESTLTYLISTRTSWMKIMHQPMDNLDEKG